MVVDSPVMLEYTYIPLGNIPVVKEEELINNSLFETLRERYDIFILKAEQELIAAGASKEIAKIFSVKESTPVLHVYRRYSTNKSDCYIYSSFYCLTEKFSIGNIFF
jgi:DNA-binding GntR family transcriptional regulator